MSHLLELEVQAVEPPLRSWDPSLVFYKRSVHSQLLRHLSRASCIFNYCELNHLYSTPMSPLLPSCKLATSSCGFLYTQVPLLTQDCTTMRESTGFPYGKGMEMREPPNQPVGNSYINQDCEQRAPFSCLMIRDYHVLQSEEHGTFIASALSPCFITFLWEPQEAESTGVSLQEAMFPMNHGVLERHLHMKPRLTHCNMLDLCTTRMEWRWTLHN